MQGEPPTPKPASEHPFTRALRTWETWSSADTWTRVVANARQDGQDLGALGDLDELTCGPLEALRANRDVVDILIAWQWQALRAAREQGHSWSEIGRALGVEADQARSDFLAGIERKELIAQRMSDLGPLLRYDPRWRELACDNDADRER